MKTKIVVKSRNQTETPEKITDQLLRTVFAMIGISACIIGVWALISLLGSLR